MRVRPALALFALSAASVAVAAPMAMAKGGEPGGGTTTPPPARCAKATVTNTGQTVRNLKMPELKYNLENCGTDTVPVTVSIGEAPGFLSDICPSPTVAPASFVLAPKQKISVSAPTFRGPCGYSSPRSFTIVWSSNAWQGHNLNVAATDDATGAVLSTGSWFSWQDDTNTGV